jgi:hypothetical protein
MQNRKTKVNADIIAREERRRKVAQYMQQSLTEVEIAARLNVDPATVSRDVQVLKKTAQDFIYSLAKETLPVFYKDVIDNLLSARDRAWDMYLNASKIPEVQRKDKLAALKLVIASNQSAFELLLQVPTIMSVKSLEEGLKALQYINSSKIM